MPDPTPLEEQLLALAQQAKMVQVDGQIVSRRSLSEIIEADKYLANRTASRTAGNGLGIRFQTLRGAAGGSG